MFFCGRGEANLDPWKTTLTMWFKKEKWPFDSPVGGHDSPFKGSLNHPEKVTSRIARYITVSIVFLFGPLPKLALAQLDQQSCDRGSYLFFRQRWAWRLHPHASFSKHVESGGAGDATHPAVGSKVDLTWWWVAWGRLQASSRRKRLFPSQTSSTWTGGLGTHGMEC